jgi:hypothetical protein
VVLTVFLGWLLSPHLKARGVISQEQNYTVQDRNQISSDPSITK